MRQWNRQDAEGAYAEHLRHPVGVMTCRECRHPWLSHFELPNGGCVAARNDTPCSCSGFHRGVLPHAITKHLTPLEDMEIPSPCGCGHALDRHSDDRGCWSCGCAYGKS